MDHDGGTIGASDGMTLPDRLELSDTLSPDRVSGD